MIDFFIYIWWIPEGLHVSHFSKSHKMQINVMLCLLHTHALIFFSLWIIQNLLWKNKAISSYLQNTWWKKNNSYKCDTFSSGFMICLLQYVDSHTQKKQRVAFFRKRALNLYLLPPTPLFTISSYGNAKRTSLYIFDVIYKDHTTVIDDVIIILLDGTISWKCTAVFCLPLYLDKIWKFTEPMRKYT